MIRPETKKHKLGNHVFITAEIGTNHTGSINIAKKIVTISSTNVIPFSFNEMVLCMYCRPSKK